MKHLKRSKNSDINFKSKKTIITLCLIISFILVLIPIAFTPVSSDDFIYLTRNPTWSNLAWRYMNWSGRIVADTASLVMLQLPPLVYNFFKATIWIGLIILISQLPSILNKEYKWNMKNFLIIFILYWIANPNLGQTSFWTVGYSNYLLTNFFIMAYVVVLFLLKDKDLKLWNILAIFILGILAGNSNENTSIVVVLLTVVFILIEKNKKVFILGLPFTLIGTLSLLLSPGQSERLQHPAFQISREQSLFHRLWNYFSSPWFIDTFKSFSWVFVTFILIGFIYFFKHQRPQKQNMVYSLIFFFSAVIANAAFGGSYVFPVALRSLNGALVLFLVSITFLLNDLVYSKNPVYKKSIFYLIILLCFPFSLSYFYATKSVISLHGQFQVREQAILNGKKNKLKTIYIPNYYVGKLYNPSDSIDLYQGNIGDYYNTNASTTIVPFNKNVGFDYGNKKFIEAKQIPLHKNFGKNIQLKSLNIFQDERDINNYSINLTFDKSLLSQYSSDESILFIHVHWKRESLQNVATLNADSSLNNQISVDGKYIFSSPIGDVRPQDISSVDIGIYNTKTSTNTIQTTVDMNNK
ncbi:DUF6056 family protein [Enterococcus pseudoavium]|uniref:DUF6056 family protein n=1 Tax=Enterococcus pseudoavium TaxID=44007 RepID=A0AAE4I122_9ENTE|nr:DUF6056 family protein [Enterococcus pseudoavium]MDT2737211.1 DUF6056 family protein [Enterococcus pseudoavium]